MPAAAVNKIELPREENDCAIVALSLYLGKSYEDVLRAVSDVSPKKGRTGLWVTQIKRAAAILGSQLRLRRKFDRYEDYGIVTFPAHVAVLRNGLMIDSNGRSEGVTIWDVDAYLAHYQGEMRGLLQAEG